MPNMLSTPAVVRLKCDNPEHTDCWVVLRCRYFGDDSRGRPVLSLTGEKPHPVPAADVEIVHGNRDKPPRADA